MHEEKDETNKYSLAFQEKINNRTGYCNTKKPETAKRCVKR